MFFGTNSSDKSQKSLVITKPSSNASEQKFNNIIAEGTFIKGVIKFQNTIYIDGMIESESVSPQLSNDSSLLWIGVKGHVIGTVQAKEIHIEGHLEGDAHCEENMIVYSTAKIEGNCFYNNISMETGAQLLGKMLPKYRTDKSTLEIHDNDSNNMTVDIPTLNFQNEKEI